MQLEGLWGVHLRVQLHSVHGELELAIHVFSNLGIQDSASLFSEFLQL